MLVASYKDLTGGGVKHTFSKNLQTRMRDYGLTQTELAKRMGLPQSTISEWCRGTVLPRSNRLERLCTVFNCEPEDLLGSTSAAVEEELRRRLEEYNVNMTPEAKAVEQKIHAQLVEYYQTISQAMAALDEAALSRLAAYAEGLMASREDKSKPSAM